MKSFLELLKSRKSVRHFTDEPVSKEDQDYLIECMLRTPSSKGNRPWEFLLVDQKEKLKILAECKQPHGTAFVKDASLAVVVCADAEKSDVWIEDASLCAGFIHLAATDLGLGSCWVQVRLREHQSGESSEEFIKKQLNLPDNLRIEAIVAIGHPDENHPDRNKAGHGSKSLPEGKIHYNHF
ncbi:MAG: NAD(P)H-dependent dehydrogenase/reductase [Deltaproteobacteria bacterium]|nr:MAG: NAD(P)H-dependent dehydrogenase/reductase [Deltaproteobacteria bacterium]